MRGRIGKDREAPHAAARGSPSAEADGAEIDDQIAALRRAVEEELETLRGGAVPRDKNGASTGTVAVNGRRAVARPSRAPRLERDEATLVFRTLAAWTLWVAIGATVGLLVVYAGR